MCSRSYAQQDFGLQALGRDHLHLAATLFAFYKLAHTLPSATRGPAGTPGIRAAAGEAQPPALAPAPVPAPAQDASQNDLKWIQFGGVFLLFQELCAKGHPTRHPAGRQRAPRALLISMAPEKPQAQAQADSAVSAPSLELALSINAKVDEYCLLRDPAAKQDFAWLEIIVHEALHEKAKKSATTQGSAGDAMNSLRDLVAKYWAALSSANGKDKTRVRQRDPSAGNDLRKQDPQQSYPTTGSSSIMETISRIPMRLVRALLRQKNEAPLKL